MRSQCSLSILVHFSAVLSPLLRLLAEGALGADPQRRVALCAADGGPVPRRQLRLRHTPQHVRDAGYSIAKRLTTPPEPSLAGYMIVRSRPVSRNAQSRKAQSELQPSVGVESDSGCAFIVR